MNQEWINGDAKPKHFEDVRELLENDRPYYAHTNEERESYNFVTKDVAKKFALRPMSMAVSLVTVFLLLFKYYLAEQFYDLKIKKLEQAGIEQE